MASFSNVPKNKADTPPIIVVATRNGENHLELQHYFGEFKRENVKAFDEIGAFRTSETEFKSLKWSCKFVFGSNDGTITKWTLDAYNDSETSIHISAWISLFLSSNKEKLVELKNVSLVSWVIEPKSSKNVCLLLEEKNMSGYILAKIDLLYPYDSENSGTFSKRTQKILEQMKRVEIHVDEEDGPKPDIWIQSKNGLEIGFHKFILQLRGGIFLNEILSYMEKSGTHLLKMDSFDDEVIQGFKSFLYTGTIPDLELRPVQYLEFGFQYKLYFMKQLAELEICKQLDAKDLTEPQRVAQEYDTVLLKNEIIKILAKNPDATEKLLRKNFDKLAA